MARSYIDIHLIAAKVISFEINIQLFRINRDKIKLTSL